MTVSMTLAAITPFSTIDYPDHLSAVFFVQGCPLSCRYCHNPDFQNNRNPDGVSFKDAMQWLQTRHDLLDAVVFSGGEPTSRPNLAQAVKTVRSMGFKTGIHTAGIYPRRLRETLPHLDWIGLDFKGPVAGYPEMTGIPKSDQSILDAIAMLQDLRDTSRFEIRTTVHLQILTPDTLLGMAKELKSLGITQWTLQEFSRLGCADEELLEQAAPLTDEIIAPLKEIIPDIRVRKAA